MSIISQEPVNNINSIDEIESLLIKKKQIEEEIKILQSELNFINSRLQIIKINYGNNFTRNLG